MALHITLTGSYPPPLSSKDQTPTDADIQEAINLQIDAGLTILVDGQMRADIARLFASVISSSGDQYLPLKITGKIEPPKTSATVHDFMIAQAAAGGRRPVKAHLTGPVFLAENCRVTGAPYKGSTDRNLITDIAQALATEARFLREAGAEIVQIDEPTLGYGPLTYDKELAFGALEEIRKEISGLSVLHVCGDVTDIFDILLDAPVDVLNVEWEHLRKIDVDFEKLRDKRKRIALGCMAVDTDAVEELPRLEHTIRTARKRLKEGLWGVTPNCGLSQSVPTVARRKMERLAEAVRSLEGEASHVNLA